jgi:hypothetical protein
VNFSNYADFRNKVQVMLDGDDISTSDLSVSVLDLIIGAGEVRIYREVRSSTQDTALSLTTTGNLAALPSDFLELRGAPYVANKAAATYAPWEAVQNAIQLQDESVIVSNPVRYTFQGDNLLFFPAQADGTVITGQYYKRFADLSTGLNALFNRHPDLFLYAALVESAVFVGESTRGPMWEAKYASLVISANEQERRRVTRGSKLQTRVA